MLRKLTNRPKTPAKWLMSLDELKHHSPSRKDGVSFEQENIFRFEGIEFISQMATEPMIRLNRTFAIPTSYMYFQRYYAKNSVQMAYERDMICLACLYLACKVEDSLRSGQELIQLYRIVKRKREIRAQSNTTHENHQDIQVDLPRLSTNSQEYIELKEKLVQAERQVIQVICFDFAVVHPIHYVETLLRCALDGKVPSESLLATSKDTKLAIIDSMYTIVGLVYPAEEIAAACSFFHLTMKHSDAIHDGAPWLEKLGVSQQHLEEILKQIAEIRDFVTTTRSAASKALIQKPQHERASSFGQQSRPASQSSTVTSNTPVLTRESPFGRINTNINPASNASPSLATKRKYEETCKDNDTANQRPQTVSVLADKSDSSQAYSYKKDSVSNVHTTLDAVSLMGTNAARI